jgi:hypothetical protein
MQLRANLNLQSSYLTLLGAGIIGLYHPACLLLFFKDSLTALTCIPKKPIEL